MPSSFEVPFAQVEADTDTYIDDVFSSLSSEFMTMPMGNGFIDYPVFEQGYEALKRATGDFRQLTSPQLTQCVYEMPISMIVLRTMLGCSPPELAYVTSMRTGVTVDQGAARAIDRRARMAPLEPIRRKNGITEQRIEALVATACELITEGVPDTIPPDFVHRLDKVDTKLGLDSLRASADIGISYAVLLYERFLGRPFATYRDSVSNSSATRWRVQSKGF